MIQLLRALLLALLFAAWPARAAEDPPDEGGDEAATEAADEAEDAPAKTGPEQVTVGVYVNDILQIDLVENAYQLDFYLWFRWKDGEMDPATSMEILNPFEQWGLMVTPNYEEPQEQEDGSFYQALRIQGKFSKKLPLYNYPFDRQTLVVTFEDSVSEAKDLQYVPDAAGAAMNPELILPGFIVSAPELVIGPHHYTTTFGDADVHEASTYSSARIEIPIRRPALAYGIKLLLPVICVVLCAALMMILAPRYVDSRVGIGITTLLTVVALQMSYNDTLPDVGYLMLMDKVYLCAYAFVIAGLSVVMLATRLHDGGEPERAARLHQRALLGLLALWSLVMVVLVSAGYNAG